MSNETNNTTSQSAAPESTSDSMQAAPESTVTVHASPLDKIIIAPSKMHLEFSEKQPKKQKTQSPETASGDKEE